MWNVEQAPGKHLETPSISLFALRVSSIHPFNIVPRCLANASIVHLASSSRARLLGKKGKLQGNSTVQPLNF